jgi:hypothetical protein
MNNLEVDSEREVGRERIVDDCKNDHSRWLFGRPSARTNSLVVTVVLDQRGPLQISRGTTTRTRCTGPGQWGSP